MENTREYFEANKELWNKRAVIHEKSEFYNTEEFMQGKSSLIHIEKNELGDVTNKKLLHLQCHFGQDTLSWERLGAKVTGVDFSEEAIRIAKALTASLKLNASFICSNIYDLEENLKDDFDIVFTSYGVIGWLPDLNRWAEIISHFLRTGGTFYMVEFHPVVWMFDDKFDRIQYAYHNEKVITQESEGTYADRNAAIKNAEYSWNHSLSEVLNALISHGLKIEFLNEFPYSPYNCFQNTVKGADGNWRIKNLENLIPMVYSIKATKA